MRRFTIANKTLTQDSVPYVIAEIGTNHGGDPRTAIKMVESAIDCGVQAIKLQKRTNKKLFTKEFYNSPYNSEAALAPTYGEHREKLELPKGTWLDIRSVCDKAEVDFIATAFDPWALDFIMDAGVDAIKIASGDLLNTPLQALCAQTGLPTLISCGGGTFEDIDRAYIEWDGGYDRLCLLHCTAAYPCPPEDMNLKVIETMRDTYPNALVGLSDHQNGIALAMVGFAMGARVFEKHFTLNRASKGTDHAFSLEPTGLRKLVRDLGRAHQSLGDGVKRPMDSEQKPLFKMGKKIVAAKPLSSGICLTREDMAFKSPNDGLPPYKADEIEGKYLTEPLQEDDNIEKGWGE